MKKTLIATVVAAAFCSHAVADTTGLKSARRLAMGSTGVASAQPLDASFANPAMAAMSQLDENDAFALLIPGMSVGGNVDEDIVDTIDDIQRNTDDFNLAVDANDVDGAKAAATRIRDDLVSIDNQTVNVTGSAGLAFMVPGHTFAVGGFVSASVLADVRADIAQSDLDTLDAAIAADDASDLENLGDVGNEFESSGNMVAFATVETGITLASRFDVANRKLAIGITPKRVELMSYDYRTSVSDFDDGEIDADDYKTETSGTTLDLGAATAFGENEAWTAGLMIRNLKPLDLDTLSGLQAEMQRQTTVGIARTTETFTVTGDLDINGVEPLEGGPEYRYAGLGAELDVGDILQLRTGIRKNLSESSESAQVSAGVGLSILAARIEAGVAGNSDRADAAINLAVAF